MQSSNLQIENKYIETTLGKIFYVESGRKDGEVCLFLHGWSKTSSFRKCMFMFEPLDKLGYRVIAIDIPGFGESQTHRPFSCSSSDNMIKNGPVDIIEQILNNLNIINFNVFGFSWGGGEAISLALKLKVKVLKLALFMPSYTEIKIELDNISQKTLILWFKEDQLHSFKLGRHLSNRIKLSHFIELKSGMFEASKAKNNYEQFKHLTVPLFLNFLK